MHRFLLNSSLLTLIGMMVVTLCVYAYYVFVPVDKMGVTNYHGLLGEAFLSGHTYLTIEPHPYIATLADPYEPPVNRRFTLNAYDLMPENQYKLQDASYYNQKYYLYFGPVPALLLWVPVRWLTGVELTDEVLALVFASIGTLSLCALVVLVARQLAPDNPRVHMLGLCFGLLSIAFGTWLPFLLRRGHFYEVAISGAYCFIALGVLCLWLFLKNRHCPLWLGLASLCFGLAAGCRITHVLSGIFLLLALLHVLRHCASRTLALRYFAWMSVPMAVCIFALGYYNYVRFDSPLDNGWKYQFTLYNQNDPAFRPYVPETAPLHLYKYLLKPLTWADTLEFPFFTTRGDWGRYPSPETEPAYGIFTNGPFALFFLLFLFDRRCGKEYLPETKIIISGLTLYGCVQLFFISMFFFSTSRYAVDFAPWMMAAAAIYYLHLLTRYEKIRHRTLLLVIGAVLAGYTMFTGTMSAYCGVTHAC